MNRKKTIIFGIFLVMIPTIFTSCSSAYFSAFAELWNESMFNGKGPVFSQLDNGGKSISTKWSTLKEEDFQGSNFFITDTPNKYFTDLNVQTFNLIKKNLKNGYFYPYPDDLEIQLIKEAIDYYPSDGIIIFKKERQEKDGKKGTMAYGFSFDIDQQAYKEWTENLAYIKKCDEQIESCNWIIDNCSNKTIKEQEVVQVPVTKQRYVRGDSGIRAGSGGSWTIIEATPDHYEEYTDYEDRVQYYTVANPNYNPGKVAQAKQYLPSWQNSKSATLEKMKYLPFSLINLNLGEGDLR